VNRPSRASHEDRERKDAGGKGTSLVNSPSLHVSAQTEAGGPGAERRHQTELEEAVGWKSLSQGREGDQEEKR